nr:hypothetical protein [uncultured Flavobacterium sp.]
MSRIPSKKNQLTIFEKIKFKKNEFFRFYITRILKHLTNYLKKINTINGFENPDNFEDFGPIVLSNEEDKHSKKIKYAIDNPNILNLALTGPLGSGKSTILKTFKHNYLEYNYLDISLATFDKKTLDTEKIEHNILKQLFYSVEHKQIPESRFKRIENLKGIKLKTFLFLLWLCSLSYFLKVEFFNELIKTLNLNYQFAFLSFIYGLYFIAYSAVLAYKLMTFILNFKLTKFKIKDVDFDNDQDKKTINFENEIDEILYFFERNPIEIVFFQDLDRFNESEIFIKLREINNLINNYEPIKKKRKVTFIYAVSDDIFKENERAKFFDFIIPVIPVINYSSSSSKLLTKLDSDIKSRKLSKDFIDDVSLFLNDYRTIKSIYNEYQIYKNIIGKQLDNYNNLLAMMIYKNIEPTDFDKLNSNQGYVFMVFENTNDLIKERIENFDNKIDELNIKIFEANNEKLKDVKELRMLYILKFFELVISQNSYSVFGFFLNGKKCLVENLVTDEFFDLFIKETNINYFYNQYHTTSSSISFSQIEKSVDKIKYSERLEIVLNKQTESINQIKIELQDIENKRKELNSKKLYEILNEDNSIEYFKKYSIENKKINNINLINYLLSEGYINEDYNHYISYFYPGSITKEDNDFLMSLLSSEKPLPFNHKLKEINSLIKRIKPENFNKKAILNFTLVDYIIENKLTNKLNSIITLISNENKTIINFVDDYLNYANENNKSIFFKNLFSNNSEIWNYILSKSNFTQEIIELYLTYIFKYLDYQTIKNTDKKHKLSNYISELNNLSCFENEINIDLLHKFLKDSSTEFKNLTYDEKHRSLFEFIYNNNIYEINEKMIELFISHFNQNNININNLKNSNYTTIKESGMSKLIEYIDKDLDIYLEDVFLKLENNTNESQESICSILNNENVNIRLEIIQKGKFSIIDLSKINEIEIQSALIKFEKINPTWKNIVSYYKKSKEIDQTIIDYLNIEHHYNALSKQPHIDDSDVGVKTSFSKDLINSDISENCFSKIINNIPYAYKNGVEFISIGNSKMKLLIEFKRILLSTDNFTLINDEFDNLLIFLLEINIIDFIKSIEKYTLDSSIILKILKSQAFNASQKLSVIENTTDDVLMNNKNLLEELSKFLLENKISKISSALLIALITNSTTHKDKVELTNNYFNFIENFNLSVVIEKIEEFSKLLIGKHPKVDNIKHNQQLIKNLEGKLISNKKVLKDTKKIELFPYLKSRI